MEPLVILSLIIISESSFNSALDSPGNLTIEASPVGLPVTLKNVGFTPVKLAA